MSRNSLGLAPQLSEYVQHLSEQRESPVLAELRKFTAEHPEGRMQISVEQGRLLALLALTVGARRALEVGVFTGYSALCVAEQLPPDGTLVACDVSEPWTAIAREFWERAGLADRIDLRLAPAATTLADLLDKGEAGTYDLAFIDAEKEGYGGYYEQCLALLRRGGLMAFDNAFLGGRVADPAASDGETRVVRGLSEQVYEDKRVDATLIPIGDGLLLVRKR